MKFMNPIFRMGLALVALASWQAVAAPKFEAKPADPYFDKFTPLKAPAPGKLLLKKGDRLAIVGDSITEQRMYSQLIETYLTVCVPELQLTTRQFGWSGETAEGFLGRMTNDCLSFNPTVATTCFGMNDFKYRPYDEANGQWYRERYTSIARAFKAHGVRLVLGSPGCVGKIASWVKSAGGTVEEQNLSLCTLRNLDVEIAKAEDARFADVFWPLFTSGFEARKRYGAEYELSGKDGVHPGWAGHLVMAYAYLRAMGLDGDLGTLTVDLDKNTAKTSRGHSCDSAAAGEYTFTSQRYPFCATGPLDQDSSIRSGMTLVPFNRELNRFLLVAKGGSAPSYRVAWGAKAKVFNTAELRKGVNLAEEFDVNPFSEAFEQVNQAVAAKQAYETKQIKEAFHSAEAQTNLTAIMARTEAERAPLAEAIRKAYHPVTHTLRIEPQ
jgi:lysophospholipase L1-like esterase